MATPVAPRTPYGRRQAFRRRVAVVCLWTLLLVLVIAWRFRFVCLFWGGRCDGFRHQAENLSDDRNHMLRQVQQHVDLPLLVESHAVGRSLGNKVWFSRHR